MNDRTYIGQGMNKGHGSACIVDLCHRDDEVTILVQKNGTVCLIQKMVSSSCGCPSLAIRASSSLFSFSSPSISG